jgi:hypothetical protein
MIAGPDLSRIQNFGDSREGYGVMAVPCPVSEATTCGKGGECVIYNLP